MSLSEPKNIAVIGARRKNQGTGGYIATHFTRQGCRIQGIVGTSDSSVSQALNELNKQGIKTHGYLDVSELFANKDIDIVVVATPPAYHLEYVEHGLNNNCHIFCEKPLCSPISNTPLSSVIDKVKYLLNRFRENGLCLHISNQWPYTLPAFNKLFPDVSLTPADIRSFAMELCPESSGMEMIVDAAPHLLSMLHALLGQGEVDSCRIILDTQKPDIQFDYRHDSGETSVELHLTQHSGQPKPAAYAINGCRMERKIDMKDYSFSFSGNGTRIAAEDPLQSSVRQCLKTISDKSCRDDIIIGEVEHLYKLIDIAHEQNPL